MNQMKITFTGELIRRWKETTRNGKEMFYVAVKVPRGEYSDTLKVKARDAETVKPFAVGAQVNIEAFVGGREWKNESTGKVSYFVDVNLYKISAVTEPAKAEEPDPADVDDVEMPF